MKNNSINSDEQSSISKLARYTTRQYNELNLSHETLDIQELAEYIEQNTSTIKIYLTYNNISDEGIKRLSEALKNNRTLTNINLSENNIGDEGIKYLSEALKINNSITWIDLSSNNIGDEGIKYLSEALKINSGITWIDLSYNNIGDEGIKYLSEALKIKTSITWISLECNNIGDEGIEYLSEALKINTSIASINLARNNIADEGMKYLSEAFKVNSSIASIDLEENKIAQKGGEYLCESLKANNTITEIYLGKNKIFYNDKTTIEELIKHNIYLNKKVDETVENIFNLSPDIFSIENILPMVQKLVQIKLAKTLEQKINNLSKESLIELNESIYKTYHESEIFDNTCEIMYEKTKKIFNLGLYQHFLKLKFATLGTEFLNKMDKIFLDNRDSLLKQDLVELLQYLDPQKNPIAEQDDKFETDQYEKSKSFMELLRNRPMKVIIEELTNLDLENLSESKTINWEFIVNMINKIKVNLNKESAWTKDILDIPIFYNEIVLPDNSGIVKHTKIERNNISHQESQSLEWEEKKQIEAHEEKLLKEDSEKRLKEQKLEKQNDVAIHEFKNFLGDAAEVGTLGGDQDGEAEVDN